MISQYQINFIYVDKSILISGLVDIWGVKDTDTI